VSSGGGAGRGARYLFRVTRRAWLAPVVLLGALGLDGGARGEESGAFPWSRVHGPAAGPAEAIGGYSAGCMRGAVELPSSGRGFVVMRPERGRVFGQPSLVAFLRELGARVLARRVGLLRVGDLGQPRGGPAPTGHASHQTGLDVDVWYLLDPASRAREPSPVVDVARRRLTSSFSPRIARVLQLVVADARVDRVFVNPVVKRALCDRAGADRAWLRKVRPWWAHHEHFHVRLACPSGSPDCEAQAPLPPGDGCDELDWWLKPKSVAERDKQHHDYQSRIGSAPVLPARCQEVLDAPGSGSALDGERR